MTNWEVYVKESYQLIKEAEQTLTVTLEQEIEAYIVHLFAHFLDKPTINTEPMGVKYMSCSRLPVTQRKTILKSIGDECLLINAMEWNRRRWPSDQYYAEIGSAAYMSRAYAERPTEDLFDDLAGEFETATKILRNCRVS